MIKITETEVFGFRAAFRDMRNPKESWDLSDSRFGLDCSQDVHMDLIIRSGPRISCGTS